MGADPCGSSDTWVISLLYIGTFGSFIGFAFAFGRAHTHFAAGGQSAAQASLARRAHRVQRPVARLAVVVVSMDWPPRQSR